MDDPFLKNGGSPALLLRQAFSFVIRDGARLLFRVALSLPVDGGSVDALKIHRYVDVSAVRANLLLMPRRRGFGYLEHPARVLGGTWV